MLGISGEHLLVLLVILLIFGPKRLPDLGHSIGRTLKNFKDGMSGGDSAEGKAPPREAAPTQIAASPAKAKEPAAAAEESQEEKTEKERV